MHLWIDNILACPIDGHAPLNARLFNDEQDGILHCDQCDGAFAVIRGVPHLVRAPLRELDEERRMLERSPRDFAPMPAPVRLADPRKARCPSTMTHFM